MENFSGWLCKERFSLHFSTKKRCSKRRFPLAKTVNLAVWAFSSNFLYSQYYLHPLGPLCKKIITVLGLFPLVTFAHQNVGLICNLNICISTRNTLQGYNKHHIRLNSRTNCRVPHVLSLTPYTKPSMRITHSTIPRFQPWSQDNRHWPWLFIRVIAITHERPILSQPSCLLNFWNGGGVNCHQRFEANFTLFSQCKHLRIPHWAHTLQPFLYFLKRIVLQ